MSRFDDCFQVVVGIEGGYSNHPKDWGGETKYGIADAADGRRDGMSDLDGDGVPDVKVADITLEQAKGKYQRVYWRAVRADILPPPLDLVMFDSSVNHGPSQAVRLLQAAVAVPVDGGFGPLTKRAVDEDIHAYGAAALALNVLREREAFYERIIMSDPSQRVFELGWKNRISHLRALVLAYC